MSEIGKTLVNLMVDPESGSLRLIESEREGVRKLPVRISHLDRNNLFERQVISYWRTLKGIIDDLEDPLKRRDYSFSFGKKKDSFGRKIIRIRNSNIRYTRETHIPDELTIYLRKYLREMGALRRAA